MLYSLFKKRVDTAFKSNQRPRGFRSFNNIETILILFDYKDRDEMGPIVQDLRNNGKHVLLWTLRTEEAKSFTTIRGMKILTKDDLSSLKILSSDIKNEYKWLRYDTLFNFTSLNKERYDVLAYLLAENTAEFCIGIEAPEEHRIFDLIVHKDPTQGLIEVYEQIKSLTQNNIQSK